MTLQIHPIDDRLAYARSIVRGEAAALLDRRRSARRFVFASRRDAAPLSGPNLHHWHRQIGRCWPENRWHAQLDRHPRLLPRRHPRRPRRSRHGSSRRCRARPVAERRDRGNHQSPAVVAPIRPGPDRPDRQRAEHPGEECRRGAHPRPARGSLPARPGAQHEHDRDDCRRRRPRFRLDAHARIHPRGFRPLPSRRQPGPKASQSRGGDARKATTCGSRLVGKRCARCSPTKNAWAGAPAR